MPTYIQVFGDNVAREGEEGFLTGAAASEATAILEAVAVAVVEDKPKTINAFVSIFIIILFIVLQLN